MCQRVSYSVIFLAGAVLITIAGALVSPAHAQGGDSASSASTCPPAGSPSISFLSQQPVTVVDEKPVNNRQVEVSIRNNSGNSRTAQLTLNEL
jgi:hypothetical protein